MSQQKGKTSLAYARLGRTTTKCKGQSNPLFIASRSPSAKRSPRNSGGDIYESILNQMALESNQYISGLVGSQNRMGKSMKKMNLPHGKQEDEQDEMAYTLGGRGRRWKYQLGEESADEQQPKTTLGGSPRRQSASRESTSRPKFFEGDPQSAQKYRKNHIITTNFQTPRDNATETQPEFMTFLDKYVNVLSQSGKKGQFEDRKVQKQKIKTARKIQMYQKKFKEMQLSNHLQVKKLKKRDMHMRGKIHELQQHVVFLTAQLERQRDQRQKMEYFLNQFKIRFNLMRKNSKSNPGILSINSKFSNIYQTPYEYSESDELLNSFDELSSKNSLDDHQFGRNVVNQISKNSDSNKHKKPKKFFKPNLDISSGKENSDWP